MSFEMVRTKKYIFSKCFCFVTHGVYYFTTFVVSSPVSLQRLDWALHLMIWSDLNYVDTIQSMNGIICWYNLLCFENNMTQKSNLMILDNLVLIIHECYYSCLVFLFTGKLNQILTHSGASGNMWFMTWFQSGHI